MARTVPGFTRHPGRLLARVTTLSAVLMVLATVAEAFAYAAYSSRCQGFCGFGILMLVGPATTAGMLGATAVVLAWRAEAVGKGGLEAKVAAGCAAMLAVMLLAAFAMVPSGETSCSGGVCYRYVPWWAIMTAIVSAGALWVAAAYAVLAPRMPGGTWMEPSRRSRWEPDPRDL